MTKLIKRINELAKKSKVESLTDDELIEQSKLRKEYLSLFRSNFENQIKNIKVVDNLGNDITPIEIKKLKKQKED